LSRGLVDLRNPIQRQLFEARAIMLAVRTAAMILRAIILRSPVGLKVPRRMVSGALCQRARIHFFFLRRAPVLEWKGMGAANEGDFAVLAANV